jgi:hypothetical protein
MVDVSEYEKCKLYGSVQGVRKNQSVNKMQNMERVPKVKSFQGKVGSGVKRTTVARK